MITYHIKKTKGEFTSVELNGHALFAKNGNDIVCAAVSTAVYMTINQIEIFELLDNIKYEISEARFSLKVILLDDNLNKILSNLAYTLNDLNDQYPKHISMLNKEE